MERKQVRDSQQAGKRLETGGREEERQLLLGREGTEERGGDLELETAWRESQIENVRETG